MGLHYPKFRADSDHSSNYTNGQTYCSNYAHNFLNGAFWSVDVGRHIRR